MRDLLDFVHQMLPKSDISLIMHKAGQLVSYIHLAFDDNTVAANSALPCNHPNQSPESECAVVLEVPTEGST